MSTSGDHSATVMASSFPSTGREEGTPNNEFRRLCSSLISLNGSQRVNVFILSFTFRLVFRVPRTAPTGTGLIQFQFLRRLLARSSQCPIVMKIPYHR